jgi:hypothetical protein
MLCLGACLLSHATVFLDEPHKITREWTTQRCKRDCRPASRPRSATTVERGRQGHNTHCAIGIRQYVMNSSTDDENQREMAVKFILRVSLLCYKFGTALRRYSKYLKKCLTRDSNQRPRKIIRFPGSHFIHWAMGTYKNRAISSMYDANRRIEHAELILRVSLLCYKFGTALRRFPK